MKNILLLTIFTSVITISGFFVANKLSAQVMSSGSYSLQGDSINFSGGDSSSASYNQESTVGEVGTGDSDSASYSSHAGYQQQLTSDTTDPSVPTNLSATAVSSSQINLSWTASTDNIGIGGYRIFRDSSVIATTTSTSYSNTGLSTATTYSYTVEAFDTSYNYSGESGSVTGTTNSEDVSSGGSSGSRSLTANLLYSLGILSTTTSSVSSPLNVSVFKATPRTNDILLSWQYTGDVNVIDSFVVVKSADFYPSDLSAGEVIFNGKNKFVTDVGVNVDTRYYYVLFIKDLQGNYSSGVLTSAEIKSYIDPAPVVEEPVIPIIPVVDEKEIDPKITALTISDFDFIQDGRVIEGTDGIVAIDQSKNLSVKLDYEKVPEVLKTITVTLVDPKDSSSAFTFLLKVNKNKTAYESTIAPLAKSGSYEMKILVVDYKNQGVKLLEGELKALGLGEADNIKFKGDQLNVTRLLIVIGSMVVILLMVIKILKIYV